jgi:hypothetical protein
MNLWMLGDNQDALSNIDPTAFCGLWDQVLDIVSMVIWILVGILAVILIVKGVTTALAVVKAADEPQVRQEKLGAFKYLAIGMGVALVIAILAGTLLTAFGTSMLDKAFDPSGATKPCTDLANAK